MGVIYSGLTLLAPCNQPQASLPSPISNRNHHPPEERQLNKHGVAQLKFECWSPPQFVVLTVWPLGPYAVDSELDMSQVVHCVWQPPALQAFGVYAVQAVCGWT